MIARFQVRSAIQDVEAGLQPERLAIPLDVEGANTRLLWLAYRRAQGGRITECKDWSVARWYTEVGFYSKPLLARLVEHELARWEGDDLVMLEYIPNHEKRIRHLWELAVAMTATRLGNKTPPSTPTPGGYSHRVNSAKVFKTPTTVPSTVRSTDSGAVSDPDPSPSSKRKRSEPPEPPHEDRGRGTERRIEGPRAGVPRARLSARTPTASGLEDATGPEGFERWVEAMPLVREPRSAAAARRWREENLEYWVRYDLEGEAELILEEVERLKHSDAWNPPRFIPSPMNFLRRASWRRRPKVQPPKVWGAPEVFEPAATWAPPEAARDHLASYLRDLVASKGAS